MFVLKEVETFTWNVKARVPADNSKHQTVQFMATFNVMDQDVHDELIVNEKTRDVKRFLEMALVNFRGIDVVDESGNMVGEDNDDERNRIIRKKGAFIEGLLNAYGDGALNAKSKN